MYTEQDIAALSGFLIAVQVMWINCVLKTQTLISPSLILGYLFNSGQK